MTSSPDPDHSPAPDAPDESRRPSGGASQTETTCPLPCTTCAAPGDCEDCLDCLYWPARVDDEPEPVSTPRGYAHPSKAAELDRARAGLGIADRVGLLSRRHRRLHHLSQRDMAAEIGWSRSSLGRLESDAGALTVAKVDGLLRHIGFRLALLPVDPAPPDPEEPDPEPPDPVATAMPIPRPPGLVGAEPPSTWWGAEDLLARDAGSRRPPPDAQVTWHTAQELREDSTLKGRAWTWRRPQRGSAA